MATLLRLWKTYYVNAEGKRVPKGTPKARCVRERSAKWYGQGIPGLPAKKRIPLALNREVAKRKLEDLIRAAERGDARMPDQKAIRLPLSEHLVAFGDDVSLGLASRGGRKVRVPEASHVRLIVQRVRDSLAGAKLLQPVDLNDSAPNKLARFLLGQRAKPRSKGGLSAQSAEYHLSAMRRFARWMSRRLPVKPDLFDSIPSFNPAGNRVHERREVTAEELASVLEAARSSKKAFQELCGNDRYHLYLTAFATGYRASELAELVPEGFALDADPPMVRLPAPLTKNKKRAQQPIPPGVANQLRAYLADRPSGARVWPGTWNQKAAKMLRVDLATAGVPYKLDTIDGPQYADFHSLRHSYVTALAAAGVGPKELQVLSRHKDPRLTLGIYTHVQSAALGASVALLPIPGEGNDRSSFASMSHSELTRTAEFLYGIVACLLGLDAPRDAPGPESSGQFLTATDS